MKKAFKLIPFDSNKEQIPLKENLFYVDVEKKPDYWKDVIIISSQNLEEMKLIQEGLSQLKNNDKFKDKFIILNYYENQNEKINYYVLEELPGEIRD